jgi:hypothetical protein
VIALAGHEEWVTKQARRVTGYRGGWETMLYDAVRKCLRDDGSWYLIWKLKSAPGLVPAKRGVLLVVHDYETEYVTIGFGVASLRSKDTANSAWPGELRPWGRGKHVERVKKWARREHAPDRRKMNAPIALALATLIWDGTRQGTLFE